VLSLVSSFFFSFLLCFC